MIEAVFAIDIDGGLGNNGTLPWPPLIEDLRHFRDLTQGHVVVMGRKTWDDPKMPKPLPHRTNVVVTNREIDTPNVKTISGDITRELLLSQRVTQQQRVFVIGGAGLLNHTVGLLDTLHVTHVPGEFATDTKLDLRVFFRGWRAGSGSVSHAARCTFITYHRV